MLRALSDEDLERDHTAFNWKVSICFTKAGKWAVMSQLHRC